MNHLTQLAEPTTFVAALWLLVTLYTLFTVARGRVGGLRWMWAGAWFVFLAVATPLGGNALLLPLETAAHDAANRCRAEPSEPDLVVVFAGGADDAAHTSEDYHVLSESSLRRTLAAAHWLHADASRRVLLSGGFGNVPEAVLMARLLTDLGVQGERITLDSRSSNTVESGVNVAARIRQMRVNRVLVVTSADHMKRALAELQRNGVVTCAHPVDFSHVAPIFPGHLVPQLSALTKSTRALHEYLSALKPRQE